MKVTNPTNSDLKIQYKGIFYEVKANDSVDGVPEAAAYHWQKNIHNFIRLSEDGHVDEEQKEVEEPVEEPVEEVEESVEAEEEKPKAKKPSKKSK